MTRIAYVNGQYIPHNDAAVHIEDRGYQFADGVYEVFAMHHGQIIGEQGHMDRLEHSPKPVIAALSGPHCVASTTGDRRANTRLDLPAR